MSNQAITQAWAVQGISITQKCVLVRLADRAGDDMACWPCIDNIATECCCNRVTVIRCLKELRELGYVAWHNRTNADGSTTSNMYRLTLPSVSVTDGKATVAQSNTGVAQSNPTPLQVATGGVAGCNSNPHLNPQCEPKPSMVVGKNPKKAKDIYTDDFRAIYDLHPSKHAKEAAAKAFAKLSDDSREKLRRYVERMRHTEAWQKDGGKFAPYLRTIINERRFEDEPTTAPERPKHFVGIPDWL